MSVEGPIARVTNGSDAVGPHHDEEPSIDSVPDVVRAAARRAIERRDRDAIVLDIVGDSVLDQPDRPGPREVTFAELTGPLSLQVVVAPLVGGQQVTLDVSASVDGLQMTEAECAEGSAQVQVTGDRSWRVGPLAPGLISLVLDRHGRRLRTSWLHV